MNPSAAIFCLCMVAVYSAGEKPNKTKRDVSGLYPFPRVGKGDVSWGSQIFGPREMKRQGLIPFPRVGRNRDEDSGKKRDAPENGGGMWFGPRLGRLQKRNHFNEDGNWALVQIRARRNEGKFQPKTKHRLLRGNRPKQGLPFVGMKNQGKTSIKKKLRKFPRDECKWRH